MKLTRQQAIEKNEAAELESKKKLAKSGVVSGSTLVTSGGVMYGMGKRLQKDRDGYIKSRSKTILKDLVKFDGYKNIGSVPKEAMVGLKERAKNLATKGVDGASSKARTGGKIAIATGTALAGYSLYKHNKLKKGNNDTTKKKD